MDMVEWLLNSGWPSVTLRNRHTKLARLATELRKQRESFSAFLTKKEQDALGDTVRLLTRLKRELTMAAEKKRQLEEEQRTEWERRDREKAEAAARTLFVGMNSQEVVSTCENLNVYLDEVGGVTWTLSREKAEATASTLFVGMISQEVVNTCENLNVYQDKEDSVTWTLSREIRRYF